MAVADALTGAAAEGRLHDLHELLLHLTGGHDEPPLGLLRAVAELLPPEADADRLPPRPRVVMRLLRSGHLEAAWLVLQDNAVGVVAQTQRTSTSSGAPRTAWRLPLTTCVEPPHVFAWLPGFRDPRHDAPEDAYDITDAVTPAVQLDELWWDGATLVLAGWAHLRHLATSQQDKVHLVLRHGGGAAEIVVPGVRRRRADLVRGTGDGLSRLAWSGWSVHVDPRGLPAAGLWKPTLRLTEQDIVREARLGPARSELVPAQTQARVGVRRGLTRVTDAGWLDLLLVDPAAMRVPRRVLHLFARTALRR